METFIIKVYAESDGENDFGPDVYIINAEDRPAVIHKINELWPALLESIKLKALELPEGVPVHIGTLLREADDEPG